MDSEDFPVDDNAPSTTHASVSPSHDNDIQLLPYQPRKLQFPARVVGKQKRSFRSAWFDLYPWLEWNPNTEAVLCHRCKVARKVGLITFSHCGDGSFSITGFRNWKHALERFKEHEQSSTHKEAVLKWSGYMNSRRISQLNKKKDEEQRARRQTLLQLFNSLRFQARQGLATRGHTDETTNYKQLLILLSQNSPELARCHNSDTHHTTSG
jgi:hypothetical protein